MRRLGASAIASLLALAACAPVRSTPATRYQGILLNAHDLGAEEVAREAREDPTIRRYVRRHGPPDFILVGGPTDVQLVYAPASRLVHFHRRAPGARSRAYEVSPLPSSLLHLLPRDLRAGTPTPFPGTEARCWTVPTDEGSCRTCCQTLLHCAIDCRTQTSTETPRQKATWSLICRAASLGAG